MKDEKNKIKTLIVDDSIIYRKSIEKALAGISDIEIIGSVWNGKKALDFIHDKTIPDFITLDVEMPEMDGIETLKAIKEINAGLPKEKRMEVLMVSSLTKAGADVTIEALQSGAFDFILKPTNELPSENFFQLKSSLQEKIQTLISKKQKAASGLDNGEAADNDEIIKKQKIEAIGIGVSTGGPKTLAELLPAICEVTDIPVFIVQHMPPEFTKSLADNLNKKCPHLVSEAEESTTIQKKNIYLAKGGKHLIVRKKGDENLTLAYNDNEPVNNSKPSVDVLFRSLSDAYNGNIVCIILTGMGCDGSNSLIRVKRAGAHVIAQDKETSVVWGMPKSAIETGNVDYILPINKIAEHIAKLMDKPQ